MFVQYIQPSKACLSSSTTSANCILQMTVDEINIQGFESTFLTRPTLISHNVWTGWARAGDPNLGYMYPRGYICLSEGVHL